MLVLTRRAGERIEIDEGRIVITVVKIRGSQVHIGVKADGMTIHREEVAERIRNKVPH